MITVVVLLVIATIAYSAYQDYTAVRSELGGGGSGITAAGAFSQTTGSESISFSVTVPNRGMYAIDVSVSCTSASPDVICQTASLEVLPGQTQKLNFTMTVNNVVQFVNSGGSPINGTVTLGLKPFASISVRANFTSLVQLPQGVP